MRRTDPLPSAFAFALAPALLLLAAAPAAAQSAGPAAPVTVVTATRTPTAAGEIPAGVTVITRQTIEARGYTTLAQALSAVPGLTLVPSGGPGGVASVFLRGTDSNHVLVLIDGVPANDPADPNGAFNFGEDTLGDVARIEVIRGPMSGLYGSGAVGGVINIITRHGEGPAHGSVSLAAGTQQTLDASAALSGRSGAFDYSLAGSVYSTSGFDELARRIATYTGTRDGFRNQTGTIDLGYHPFAGTRISLFLRARQAQYDFANLGAPAFDSPPETGHDTSWLGRLGVTSHLLDGHWKTSLFVARLADDRHYTLLDAANADFQTNNDRYHGYRTDIAWNNTLHLPDAGPLRTTSVTFGYEHRIDSVRTSLNDSYSDFPYQQSTRAHATTDAGYLGAQATLLHRLTVTGALREDSASTGGSAFTWRAGAVFALPEIASRIEASYGTSFLAPSLFDLYGVDSGGFVGNPALKPERATGFEVGFATDWAAFGRARFATTRLTYFGNDIKDLIITQFSPVFTPVNIDRARIRGVEATLALHPARWLDLALAYTYTDARNAETGSLLLRRPENQGSAEVTLRPSHRLSLHGEVLFIGRFQDFLVDNAGNPTSVGNAKPGTIVDLSLTYRLTPRLAVFAIGHNVLASRFEPVNGLQTPGPSALFGVRTRF